MKIYLHDLIGIHSGVHYYLDTFANKLIKYDIDTLIFSNYKVKSDNAYYPNIFQGWIFKRILLLVISYIKFLIAIIRLKKNEIIIVSLYGTYVDLGLLLISKISKNKVLLDVHEIVDDNREGLTLSILFKYAFRLCNNKIIAHSEKVVDNLKLSGFNNRIIFTPHINYEVCSNFNLSNVGTEIKYTFQKGFIYFLFFGNIIPSKGIFDLLSTIEKIDFNNSHAKIIIAGKDRLNNIKNYPKYKEISQKSFLILRHINDDEMKYLFSKSNYVLLPYKDISQSGVLEMAINFRKPILSSGIKYFKDKFQKYPSFGEILSTHDSNSFAREIEYKAKFFNQTKYFIEDDLEKYFNPNIFKDFIIEIKKLFK